MHSDVLAQVLPRVIGPAANTAEVAGRTEAQSDLRMGVVTTVTVRGITVAVGAQSVDAAHIDSYAPAVGDPVALMKVQDSWLALGRVVGPGNVSDISGPGPSIGPSYLGEGMYTTTATVGTAAGPVNIPGYDITFWLPAGHSALILAGIPWFGSLGTTAVKFLLQDVGVGQFTQVSRLTVQANNVYQELVTGVVVAGTVGRKVNVTAQIQLLAGGGTANVLAVATIVGYMIPLDLGDTSFTPKV